MAQQTHPSIEPTHRSALAETDWEHVSQAGCYVEVGSGDLYRIPKEALVQGGSPLITKESSGASRLVQVSNDPYMTSMKARLICAQHNIEPNF